MSNQHFKFLDHVLYYCGGYNKTPKCGEIIQVGLTNDEGLTFGPLWAASKRLPWSVTILLFFFLLLPNTSFDGKRINCNTYKKGRKDFLYWLSAFYQKRLYQGRFIAVSIQALLDHCNQWLKPWSWPSSGPRPRLVPKLRPGPQQQKSSKVWCQGSCALL